MKAADQLRYLEDRWDDSVADGLDGPELLRYRSNLLGADLRITNFGGGNTSAKLTQPDPLDGSAQEVLWVKGSGGDLGSIQRSGFATLYLRKLHALRERYRGPAFEDEMVELYPLCTFGRNPVAASIDTPLHGFLPFAHVDHLHPDWGIAMAAAASGRAQMEQVNRRFGHHLVWVPWQRPGFALAMELRRAVDQNPGCDGIVLAGHGLFTWGDSSRDCYRRSLAVIVTSALRGRARGGEGAALFGGPRCATAADHRDLAAASRLRARPGVGPAPVRRHFSDDPAVLRFVTRATPRRSPASARAADHFVRTKIRPLYVPWDPSRPPEELRPSIDAALVTYREEYRRYYEAFAQPDSPPRRDDNPSVVLIPGVGMLSFGKSKTEARITGEFYLNAIHVMEGATALGGGAPPDELPQAGLGADTAAFAVHANYVALPPSEAFRIEYWLLEEAKLRRQPPEKELSRWSPCGGAGRGIGAPPHAGRRRGPRGGADLEGRRIQAHTTEVSRPREARGGADRHPAANRSRAGRGGRRTAHQSWSHPRCSRLRRGGITRRGRHLRSTSPQPPPCRRARPSGDQELEACIVLTSGQRRGPTRSRGLTSAGRAQPPLRSWPLAGAAHPRNGVTCQRRQRSTMF